MSARPDVKRRLAELPLAEGRGPVWVNGKPIVRWWPQLHGQARSVLLAPQAALSEQQVVWSWTESAGARPGTRELELLRKRLRQVAEDLAEADPAAAAPRSVTEALARVTHDLAARSDAELAGFVAMTLQGPMIHSWGARHPAAVVDASAESYAIGGVVVVMGKPEAGHQVALEDSRGGTIGRVRSEAGGRFRFEQIPPGRYRVRGLSDRVDFPVTGLAVEVSNASVENLELRSSASAGGRTPLAEPGPALSESLRADAPPAETIVVDPPAAPGQRSRRRGALAILAAVGVVGVAVAWWSRSPARDEASPPGHLGHSAAGGGGAGAEVARSGVEGTVRAHRPNEALSSASPSERLAAAPSPGPIQPGRMPDGKMNSAKDPSTEAHRPADEAFQSKATSLPPASSGVPAAGSGRARAEGASPDAPALPAVPSSDPAGLNRSPAASPAPANPAPGLPPPAPLPAAQPSTPSPLPSARSQTDSPDSAPAERQAAGPVSPPQSPRARPAPPSPAAGRTPARADEATAPLEPGSRAATESAATEQSRVRHPTESASVADAVAPDDAGRDPSVRREERSRSPVTLEAEPAAPGGTESSKTAGGGEFVPADRVTGPSGEVTARVRFLGWQLTRVRDRVVATMPQPAGSKSTVAEELAALRREDDSQLPATLRQAERWVGLRVVGGPPGHWQVVGSDSNGGAKMSGEWLGTAGPASRAWSAVWVTDRGKEVQVSVDIGGEWTLASSREVPVALWVGVALPGLGGGPAAEAGARPDTTNAGKFSWKRGNPAAPVPRIPTEVFFSSHRLSAFTWPLAEGSAVGERVGWVDDATGWARVLTVQVVR